MVLHEEYLVDVTHRQCLPDDEINKRDKRRRTEEEKRKGKRQREYQII